MTRQKGAREFITLRGVVASKAMRWLLPTLVILLLVLPVAPAQGAVAPKVSATWEPAGLRIRLETGADPFEGKLVVTHQDSAGRVLDGAAGVRLDADTTQELTFAGVRTDVVLVATLTTLDYAYETIPGTLLPAIPLQPIPAGSSIEIAPAPGAPAHLDMHPAMPQGQAMTSYPPLFLVTPGGIEVTGYLANGSLFVRTSDDAGHHWSEPAALLDGISSRAAYAMGVTTSGQVVVVAHRLSFPESVASEPWVYATWRPSSSTWSIQGVSVPLDPFVYANSGPGLVVLPDGNVLLETSVNDPGPGFQTWRFSPAGAKDLGFKATSFMPNSFSVLARGSHVVALIRSNDDLRQYLVRSEDAGASWTDAEGLSAVTAVAPGEQAVGGFDLDTDGTAHISLAAVSTGYNSSAFYVRAPLGGAPSAQRLRNENNYAEAGTLAVADGHVVLLRRYTVYNATQGYFESQNEIMESRDAGLSFTHRALVITEDGQFVGPTTLGAAFMPNGLPAFALSDWPGFSTAVLYDPLVVPTVSTPLQVLVPPTMSPPPSYPMPNSTPTTFGPTPTATTPSYPVTSAPPPTPTPTSPTQAPLPVPDAMPIVGVNPAMVRLAPGDSVEVTVVFYNMASTKIGSEAPTFTNLPLGVHATVRDQGFRIVEGRGSYEYPVTLRADSTAPNASALAVAHSRWATDRPSVNGTFQLKVGAQSAAVAPVPPPGGGRTSILADVPAAAYVFVGTGAAAGVVVVLMRTDAGKWIVAVATLPLYTRLTKADILGNDVRAGIHAYVAANPGARLTDIQKQVDVATSTLVFHLRILQREGYVTSGTEWSRRRYYATGAVPVALRQGKDVAATLTEMLQREPGMGPAAVAARLNISRQLARYHLKQLERDGVVVAQGEGMARGYVLVARR